MKIILYSDDINLITHWEKSCDDNYTIFNDFNELKRSKDNLIIMNYSAFNTEQKDLLEVLSKNNNSVLVLHRTPNIDTAKEVLNYGAKGYGNALMQKHFINFAISVIKDGMIWLHPEFTSQLIAEIPASKADRDVSWVLSKLTDREKEVALLLKDGDIYKTIGNKLDITPRTVKAHAQSIYIKLHIKNRLALAFLLR